MKKKERQVLERLLAEQIKTIVLTDHQRIWADALLNHGPYADEAYFRWIEKHDKIHVKKTSPLEVTWNVKAGQPEKTLILRFRRFIER